MTGRIVLATFGSYGDVNPFIGIGHELVRRGFRPILTAEQVWRSHVESAGLEFRPVRPGWDVNTSPEDMPGALMARGVFQDLKSSVNDLLEVCEDADVLVSLMLVPAAPIVARKLNIPWASAIGEPMSFYSAYEPLLLPSGMPLELLKEMSRAWVQPIYRLRSELGLPPGGHPFYEEYLSADLVLGLFSPLLARPQPDWPPNSVVTGFVRYDGFTERPPISNLLEAFLAAGPPPIVFTLSSDAVNAPTDTFYESSVSAAQMLGIRAIIAGLKLPDAWVGNILCVNHVPFSQLFPRCAAIVFHAGIGTAALAMRAGKPMLVVPASFAQPDIAARLRRLQVALSLPRAAYCGLTAASVLGTLLGNPFFHWRAQALKPVVAAEDGASVSADAIHKLLDRAKRS